MKKLYPTILSTPRFEFKNDFNRVVQKGNVGSKYVYALQLYKGTTYVMRGTRDDNSSVVNLSTSNRTVLSGTAGGHTQTWEYAGSKYQNNKYGAWFVGTKGQSDGNYDWDIQLARVTFPTTASANTELTRLSHLNKVGSKQGIDFDGTYLLRTEAAVTPDYSKLMIVAIDTSYNAHIGLYNLSEVNDALNAKEASHGHVPLSDLTCTNAFLINNISANIPSLQGFDIDNQYNVYVSCQKAPSSSGNSYPRQIVKIPWGETNSNNWYTAEFNSNNSVLDEANYYTEFESIQVIDDDSLYLTVAYHYSKSTTLETQKNKIFKLSGFRI